MQLRAVKLINWRSYQNASFEFPMPKKGRNVTLIRAPNEYGKTSFFEAVVLGMFGREGLLLVPRARVAKTGERDERQKVTYSHFLEGTLHKRAIQKSCSVTLEFEDDDGVPIELTRKWHFNQNGRHKLYEDELLIFEDTGRRPVSPPVTETDQDAWFRDFIARTFIPHNVAEFFLFDGEQVQRYAKHGMTKQIRQGIEGLLGLQVLKSLKESLQQYAHNIRSNSTSTSDKTVKEVEADISRLENEINQQQTIIDQAENLLPGLQKESDDIVMQLGRGGEVTAAMVAELATEEQRFRSEAERCTEQLMKLLSGDISLALAGSALRNETIARMRSEDIREQWESGLNQGSANLERYLRDLSGRLQKLEPPVTGDMQKEVVQAAQDAWRALWHPPPTECAEEYLHSGLTSSSRSQAIEHLEKVGSLSVEKLTSLESNRSDAIDTAEKKKRERLTTEQKAPETEQLSRRLEELIEEITAFKSERDSAQRSVDSMEGELAGKRQEFGRYVESQGRSEPELKRAAQADAIAKLIDDILSDAVPTQVNSVAKAMTKAWKKMAQSSEHVDRIEITPQCEIKVLNKRGENLHEIEQSAGASQIFTQALIWAITHVSGQNFPFIVDTPLARLSRQHRLGVLNTFLDRKGQVILLSTDEEVIDDKLDAIRNRIAVAYQLRLRRNDGVAVTTVEREEI